MKLKVHLADKVYEINCGKGKQQVYWVGMEAANRYGKEHYPKGVYLPDLVYLKGKDGEKKIPHPRLRLCDQIPEDEPVYVLLKNRNKPQSKDEKWWSDRAFGYLRNMSEVKVQYKPGLEGLKRSKGIRIFLTLRVDVFEELRHEFPETRCPIFQEYELKNTSEEGEENFFETELELPWGEIKIHEMAGIPSSDKDKQKIDSKEHGEVKMEFMPRPISAKEQLELDLIDKKEHQKKEKEYRLQQKLLEEQKAKQVAEKEAQRRRLQEIGHKLEILWNSIDSKFLTPVDADDLAEEEREREASECLAICTTFYQDLFEMFDFYASTHSQVFKKKDNELITLQGFLHFVKAGRFAKSKDELQLLLQHMENAVPTPISDSLNVLNGINFAQFLEAVMRIAYARHLENNAGIAKNLQFALQDATLEIRNRRRDDEMYSSIFGHKFTKIFQEKYEFLAGLFIKQATVKSDSDYVLDGAQYEQILKDVRVLKPSAAGAADSKSKAFQGKEFTKEKLKDIFLSIPKLEKSKYYYHDFLELLVKTAALMNLKEAEELMITTITARLEHLIGLLEKKFVDAKKRFIEQCEKNNELNQYSPMYVIPDQADEIAGEVLTEEDDDSDGPPAGYYEDQGFA